MVYSGKPAAPNSICSSPFLWLFVFCVSILSVLLCLCSFAVVGPRITAVGTARQGSVVSLQRRTSVRCPGNSLLLARLQCLETRGRQRWPGQGDGQDRRRLSARRAFRSAADQERCER